MGGEQPSLYDWAGGGPALRALIDAFYDRVEADDLLSPLFPGGVGEEHRSHVTLWWCEVFGGPTEYTSRLGGYRRMLDHHRGLGITAEQRFRFATLMSRAADDAGLPDDPEFRAAFVGYVEWGTRSGAGQLSARGRGGRGGSGSAVGVGRRAPVPAVVAFPPELRGRPTPR